MKARHLLRARSYFSVRYNSINNIQYFSSLHYRVANDSIRKFYERKEKSLEQHNCMYVINPELANSIASCIAKEWNGGFLLEANAGPGILSSSLLQYGIQHLRVFEKNIEFLTALEVLSADHPSLEIVQEDLMMIPSLEYRKIFDSNQSNYVTQKKQCDFNAIFKGIPANTWESNSSFQVLSLITNKSSHKFLRYILAALPNQDTLFSFGRCDFFLLISEKEFMSMNALPKKNFSMYRWSTVLYNLFFEMKFLQKFSTDSGFFSCNTGKSKHSTQTPYFYLIKLTPKRDVFAHSMTPEKLQEFYFFVRSNLSKRSDLVIKSVERWMPFCGPRLIKEGLNVFVRFGDLSPSEVLKVFNCMASWSDYKICYLKALACKFNRKNFIEDDSPMESEDGCNIELEDDSGIK